jgi:hypothetical protein
MMTGLIGKEEEESECITSRGKVLFFVVKCWRLEERCQ